MLSGMRGAYRRDGTKAEREGLRGIFEWECTHGPVAVYLECLTAVVC